MFVRCCRSIWIPGLVVHFCTSQTFTPIKDDKNVKNTGILQRFVLWILIFLIELKQLIDYCV